MKFLENKGEEKFLEGQKDKVDFLEGFEVGGKKLLDSLEGKILEDCSGNILEFGTLACLVKLQWGRLLT